MCSPNFSHTFYLPYFCTRSKKFIQLFLKLIRYHSKLVLVKCNEYYNVEMKLIMEGSGSTILTFSVLSVSSLHCICMYLTILPVPLCLCLSHNSVCAIMLVSMHNYVVPICLCLCHNSACAIALVPFSQFCLCHYACVYLIIMYVPLCLCLLHNSVCAIMLVSIS